MKILIANCPNDKVCKRCTHIAPAIAVDKGEHISLFCAECGTFLKVANKRDVHQIYRAYGTVNDDTPARLAKLYIDSNSSMYIRL